MESTHLESGVVSIGDSWWTADYAGQYYRAADSLLKGASTDLDREKIVLPVLYLARHFAELVIKDLMLGCFHISEVSVLARISNDLLPTPKFEHDLLALQVDAKESLRKVGNTYPQELESLVSELSTIEDGSPERFRYMYIEKWKNGVAPATGFPNSTQVDISSIHRKIETVYQVCANIEDDDSLIRILYKKSGDIFQHGINSGAIDLNLFNENPSKTGE